MGWRSVTVGLILSVYVYHSSTVEAVDYKIDVTTDQYLHQAREDFLSIDLDCSLIGSHWQTFVPSNKGVIAMAKALSPAILRLGGTSCDYVIFNKTSHYRKSNYHTLSKENLDSILEIKDWDNLVKLADVANLTILFDANVMLRDNNSNWDPTNFIEFLKYNSDRNNSNLMFELGNEPNNFPVHFHKTITGDQLAADFKTLRQVVEQFPLFKKSLIVGADVGNPYLHSELGLDPATYIHDFFQAGHSFIDALTWHQYYLKGSTAKVMDFVNPSIMDSFKEQVRYVNEIIEMVLGVNRTFPVWMGETSSAYNSGAKNISNRYVAGFLWMDKLGVCAQSGYDVVIRQTFYGGSYSLIDTDLQPLPDYWLSYLYKQLVGSRSLAVKFGGNQSKLRVYASCTCAKGGFKPGAITIYAMNLDNTSSATITSTFNSTGAAFNLEPTDGTLTSAYVDINGQTMKLTADQSIPQVVPLPQSFLTLKPLTFGFLVLDDAKAKACF